MPIEHELKFPVQDCPTLIPVLTGLGGGLRTPWHFEANTVYDQNGRLASSSCLLRLRQALDCELTFKEPVPGTHGVKSRLETQCRVDNPHALEHILRQLGYTPCLRYEKFRSIWALPPGLIFLDILPFGHFLEIEARPQDIAPLAARLGLKAETGTAQSYHDLHRAWRQAQGLNQQTDFIFQPSVKKQLSLLLGCQDQREGAGYADGNTA